VTADTAEGLAIPRSRRPSPAAVSELVDLSQSSLRGDRGSALKRYGWALRLLVPALVLLVWQLGSTFGLISPRKLAPPIFVVQAAAELLVSGDLQRALAVSLLRAGTGLLWGISIGLVVGITAGLPRLGDQLFDSSLQMIRTIPFIALIPLFIVWFGIDDLPKIILVGVACIFPVYLNTYAGVRNVDPRLIEVGKTFGLNRLAIILQIILPNALPGVLIGIRYAMGTSLLALVAAEQINAAAGLGYLIMNASNEIRTDIVIVGVLIYAALGLSVDMIIRGVEAVLLPWRKTVVRK
jgi:sulfonate transport system permease protein